MVQTGRQPHDVEIAPRVPFTLLGDLVPIAFLVLALGVTIYDIGKWLSIW